MRNLIFFLLGCISGAFIKEKRSSKDRIYDFKKYKKYEIFYNLMDQWKVLEEDGISLEFLLLKQGYRKIAIYGMAKMGMHVYRELKNSSIEVVYGIDRSINGIYEDIEIKNPNGELEETDAVLVTAIMDYENIKQDLQGKIKCPIVSLEEILYEGMCK